MSTPDVGCHYPEEPDVIDSVNVTTEELARTTGERSQLVDGAALPREESGP